MRKIVNRVTASLFGPSRNDQYAALLKQVSGIALACAAHFRATSGQDVAGIIEFEHKADRVVDEIHELLDNAFIMRFKRMEEQLMRAPVIRWHQMNFAAEYHDQNHFIKDFKRFTGFTPSSSKSVHVLIMRRPP